jgi:hypothetical protein
VRKVEFQQSPLLAMPCKTCGAVEVPLVGEGTGPHAAKATCPHCESFIKWLPKRLVESQPAQEEA